MVATRPVAWNGREVMQMASDSARKLDRLVDALLAGDEPRSRAAFDELDGDSVRPLPPAWVEKIVNTAALLSAMGQSEQGCLVLEALIEHCGADASLLNNLAFAHLVGGRTARAVELWEQAARQAPDDELIRSNLAHARQKLDPSAS